MLLPELQVLQHLVSTGQSFLSSNNLNIKVPGGLPLKNCMSQRPKVLQQKGQIKSCLHEILYHPPSTPKVSLQIRNQETYPSGETSTTQRSSIKIFPKNTPPLNPLVKSLWTLSNPSKSGKPSIGTENRKKLTKGGPK